MAEFQQKVLDTPAEGLPGQLVDGVMTPTAVSYLSDGTLEAGAFAFANISANDAPPLAKNKHSGGMCLGIVVRTNTGMVESPFIAASNKYQKGAPITIAARGRVYFKVPTGKNPTVNSYACVDPATADVTFNTDASTANNTGWKVVRMAVGKTSASEGDMIILENLG